MVNVTPLPQKVLAYIRKQKLIRAGDHAAVAVSGGADSVGLLRLLLTLRNELGIIVSVVHLNHQLRGNESDADEQFVKDLAKENKLEFFLERADVKTHAQEKHLSLEAAGRELRYEFFERLLNENVVNRVCTAHSLNDQAETVLLRLVRGSGTRGLAGIYPKIEVSEKHEATVVRPLLNTSREELEAYLTEIKQDWREDSSNRDERHSRNRVRKNLLPWLEENLNPSVSNTLAETAEIARAEEEYWEGQISGLLPQILIEQNQLDARVMNSLPMALQRRISRSAATALNINLEFHHVEQILQLLEEESTRGTLQLPGGNLSKNSGKLTFHAEHSETRPVVANFDYALPVPGRITVTEIESEFHASLIPALSAEGYNPQDLEGLMDAQLLAQKLQVRNWREGDRFWPAHTKSPKKIKELLQEKRVTGPERKVWPVVVSGNEIVWMRGFPPPAHLRLKNGTRAVKIQEVPLNRETLTGD